LFDTRTKKLAGINDFANILTDIVTFDSATKAIIFAGPPPEFLVVDKWFRVTGGGGGNNGALLKVFQVLADRVITVQAVIDFSGQATLDGRIWKVINDTTIAKSSSTGSTMYNVHNRDVTTNPGDASEIALTYAEHYHTWAGPGPEPPTPVDEAEPNRLISYNIPVLVAGTEQSFIMPDNINSYRITVRDGAAVLNLAFRPSESFTNYVKVNRGTEFNSGPIQSPTLPPLLGPPMVIYFQVSKPNVIVELTLRVRD